MAYTRKQLCFHVICFDRLLVSSLEFFFDEFALRYILFNGYKVRYDPTRLNQRCNGHFFIILAAILPAVDQFTTPNFTREDPFPQFLKILLTLVTRI